MTVFSGLFRLGRDAELRRTPSGEPVAGMSLAYNYGPRTDNGRATQWIEASLWGKRAEGLVGYLLKGKAVFAVLEDVHIQTFEGRDGTPGHKLAGRVVNISSRAALGKPNRTAYSATKAALIGMSRTWALELAQHNITVTVIAPGPVATELFKQASPPGAEQTRALLAAVPLQRIAEPEEIAHAIGFLLHPLAGYMTGQTLHIDGGLTISAARL